MIEWIPVVIPEDTDWLECYSTHSTEDGDKVKLTVWLSSCGTFKASTIRYSNGARAMVNLKAPDLETAKGDALEWFNN